MMDDLVEFLRARYDDERAGAERLAARYVYPADHELAGQSYWPRPTVRAALRSTDDEDAAALIGAFSPARVLADDDAKRRIVDEYTETVRIRDECAARIKAANAAGDHPSRDDLDTWAQAQSEAVVLRGPVSLLALPYAGHPDYRQEWRP